MVPNLADLPRHILQDILQYAAARDSPNWQPNVAQVCSAFYLAAIPNLYRSPLITSKLDSFFLHKSGTIPKDLKEHSIAELVQAGHSKLAALRHVRHLSIILKPEEGAPTEVTASAESHALAPTQDNPPTPKWARLPRHVDLAQSYLVDLPGGVMPNLTGVRFGDLQLYPKVDEKPAPRLSFKEHMEALPSQILAYNTPSTWCHHYANSFPLYPPLFLVPLREETVKPTLYIHTQIFEDFMVIPGGTTYIYIHPHSPTIPADTDTTPEGILFRTYWLKHILGMVSSSPRHDVTTIIISGLHPPSFPRPASMVSLSSSSDTDDEHRIGREIVRSAEVLAVASRRDNYKAGEIVVEVKRAADMPVCPGCGQGGVVKAVEATAPVIDPPPSDP